MTTRRITDLNGADPYFLLGISLSATTDDIQRAYRRVMREAHPDMATGDEDRTKLINIARDVLLDPDLRAEYDRGVLGTAPQPRWNQPTSAWDAEDIVVDERPAYQNPYVVNRPPPAPAPGGGMGLGVWALIASILCGPLGGILGFVALTRNPRPEGANRVCAIVAVCWGAVGLLCCLGYLALGLTSGLTIYPTS